MERNETIQRIREALKRRTGKTWSVTGGKGTAWGWIKIDAPPARRTTRYRLKAGRFDTGPEAWEAYDSGQPGGNMSDADRETLAKALSLDNVHDQGESIPASTAHYREYVARAEGQPFTVAEQYWD